MLSIYNVKDDSAYKSRISVFFFLYVLFGEFLRFLSETGELEIVKDCFSFMPITVTVTHRSFHATFPGGEHSDILNGS